MLSEINALSLLVAGVGMGTLSSYELFTILTDDPFFAFELDYGPTGDEVRVPPFAS
jgi:hypothetical protein